MECLAGARFWITENRRWSTGVAPPTANGPSTLRDGTHTWRETQCLAVAEDDTLRNWKKLAQPIIALPPPGLDVLGFRDPCLWREADRWMLILGSGIRGKGGAILLYTSTDLRNWTYLHPLIEGTPSSKQVTNPVDGGDMWECPDFFPLGHKHVLLISTMGKVFWKVGTYADQRFIPEKEGVVDWGSYYAAKTMLDAKQDRILWGWIPETRPDSELIDAGWAGVMALPRTLSLNSQNELISRVTAASPLRKAHEGAGVPTSRQTAECRKILEAYRIHDLAAEISVHLRPKQEGLTLSLESENGTNFATISCHNNGAESQLRVNNITAPLGPASRSSIHLHIFLDGSVLEVFDDEGIALTARIYRIPDTPLRMKLDESAEIVSIDVWRMKAISKDRLTGSLCGHSQ